MSLSRALSAGGLIRPARRQGFCPACRLLLLGPDGAQVELAPAAFTALAFLVVAAIAWVLVVGQSSGGDEMMEMDLGSLQSFSTSWVVMMAAMMLPSAAPLVFEFARNSEGRRNWLAATGVLGLTYLSVWLAFGLVCYTVLYALPISWPDQALVGGAALVVAALYALTPIKRASEARCRELCALHGPLPFNLMRSAVAAGADYGLSCLGCSAGLMVAVVLIGMSDLRWMVILSGVVLIYKLAPAPSTTGRLLMSAALGGLGVLYAVMM